MAAAKKKSTGGRFVRKAQTAVQAEAGPGLLIGGGIRRKRSEPGLSDDELAAAASSVDILRWIVESYDRHKAEVSRLKALPDAMQALQVLGADRALEDIVRQAGIQPVSLDQRAGLALFLRPAEPM